MGGFVNFDTCQAPNEMSFDSQSALSTVDETLR